VNIDRILSSLDKVKPKGRDSWVACCPAHNDKSPSLSIKELPDGKVILNCFGGCTAEEVVNSIGLTMSDLFSEPLEKQDKFYTKRQLEELDLQAWFLAICATHLHRREHVASDDMQKAAKCYKSLKSEINGLKELGYNKLARRIKASTTMMDAWRMIRI